MDQQNAQSQDVQFNEPHSSKPRGSFFQRKTNLIGILTLLIIIAAIPLTVKFSQQRQTIEQQAATDNAFCSYATWIAVPDWLKGNGSLGSEQKRNPPGSENDQWVKPGPVIQKGQEVATYRYNYDGSLEYKVSHGGTMPVSYNPENDDMRYEYNGNPKAESAWSRFVRRVDDSYFNKYSTEMASKQISLGVLQKYEMIRIARDAVHNLSGGFSSPADANSKIQQFQNGTLKGTSSNNYVDGNPDRLNGVTLNHDNISGIVGFDIRGMDLTKFVAGNDAQTKANMLMESAGCENVPAASPTSTTPISCAEKLLVPPVGYTVNFPSYTKNICAIPTNAAGKTELGVCGDYWTSGWCNNAGDATAQQNAVYACRGWSQTGTGGIDNKTRFLLYYSNRINTIASNITASTTYEQRKTAWNTLMTEVKNGYVAFPYEHFNANKPAEEVLNNALQAASIAIFGEAWGSIKEKERMNNCPTVWDGAPTVAPTLPISQTPSTGPTPGGRSVGLIVVLHGIGAGGDNASPNSANSNQNPKRTSRPAKLIISDATDSEASRKEVSTTIVWNPTTKKYFGAVDVVNLGITTGNYTVKLKVDNYLTKRFGTSTVRLVTEGSTVNMLPEIQLITGNANNDTVLSVLDYNMLRDCVSILQPARACDAPKKLATDFNDDEKIDNVDYTLFVRELSVQQGD